MHVKTMVPPFVFFRFRGRATLALAVPNLVAARFVAARAAAVSNALAGGTPSALPAARLVAALPAAVGEAIARGIEGGLVTPKATRAAREKVGTEFVYALKYFLGASFFCGSSGRSSAQCLPGLFAARSAAVGDAAARVALCTLVAARLDAPPAAAVALAVAALALRSLGAARVLAAPPAACAHGTRKRELN
jgi:hypothetical protein